MSGTARTGLPKRYNIFNAYLQTRHNENITNSIGVCIGVYIHENAPILLFGSAAMAEFLEIIKIFID